ncbi:HAD family hydrolase [Acrocarpospora phusangensis]|uniref:HAD family hydrolase n=1 Tax=Acrocarpospora phusangensis TaxID=1070424 RepID=UPI00194ECA45|nr:HAD family hydrolase [Acrocarpospora phusangensis]
MFDVDDTLVDFSGATRDALASWLTSLGVDGSERAYALWRQAEKRHFASYTEGLISFAEQRRRRCADFCAALGLPEPADTDAWYAGYLECFAPALRLFDDVLPTLDLLAARGVTLAALSNSSSAHQDEKLRRFGVRDRFRALVCVDDVGGRGKPHPAIFHAACQALNLPPGRVIYVGDVLDTDARAATGAGLRGVWLDRSASADPPSDVPVLHRLDQVCHLLDQKGPRA